MDLEPKYGYWEVAIEKSGRIKLPTTLLKMLPENERKSFWLTHGFDDNIALWTSGAFKKKTEDFNKKNRNDRIVKKLRNAFLRNLTAVETDTQDRLVIPRPFLEKYDIDKEVSIILDNGEIEIWSKDKYQQFDLNSDEISALNEAVFGDNDSTK